MKICSICKIEQPLSSFSYRSKVAGTLQSNCKDCAKAASKANYIANTKRHVAVSRKAKAARVVKNREYIQSLKLACVECGENHIATIDFHHVDPSTKEENVSTLVYEGASVYKIDEEIRKCIVLCSNCHRKLHWNERQTPS